MVAVARRTELGFVIELPFEAARALQLVDGSPVMVSPASERGESAGSAVRYATAEEALAAFEETLPQHEAAYRELAK